VEEGTHKDLLQKEGLYKTLWEAQVGGVLGGREEKYFMKNRLLKWLPVIAIFVISMWLIQKGQDKSFPELSSHKNFPLQSVEPGTLVLYDVDETLVQPTDVYLVNEQSPEARTLIQNFQKENPTFRGWDNLVSVLLRDAHRPLIEVSVLDVIQKIRKQGGKVIALTSMNTGRVGFYDKMEKWRYEHLRFLGFVGDFGNHVFKFSGFKRRPLFYQGILAADLEDKGKVLGAFLRKIGWTPHKIIAIDDDLMALKVIRAYCEKASIPFRGYLYMGYTKKAWDEKLVRFQAHHLLKKKKWLSDTEAKSQMQKAPREEV
jgi:hypothetical protein